ncbi:MAG: FAD-binding oxidoreductase [Alphaproteobacteria bacterium]|jgi:glycine/D-amino acid oxidase-like deaminating enzyme|nr:FAD-binding oxidoreductase [Alphaproteobacteria bacterium]MDP6566796.1 FAD-binding oxidoreductase [Alphaproteobacteria bacterium]MDP6813905.1 FAD-binding oxidoreductase [Alphaproteobacteria bacterium]
MDRSADIVIIGAGIAGAASAYYLAKGGAKVVVCEKGEVAGEQSSRNWGFVRQQGRDPAEIPLMMACNRIWRELERELNADLEWLANGNVVTFADEAERAAWEGWRDTARDFGLHAELLDRSGLDRLIPGHAFDCLGGIHTESDGQAEPTKVTAAFRRAAEGRGAEFLTHCAAYEVETEAGAVAGVLTERGGIRAPVVVCAAGAWSGRLLRTLGLKLPQIWLKGSVARTTAAPIISHTATWTGVAFRQRRDGTMNLATRSTDHDLTIDSLLNLPAFTGGYLRNRRGVHLHLNRLFLDLFAGRFSKAALRRELTRHRILDPEPNHRMLAQTLTELRRILPPAAEVEIDRSWAGYVDLTPDMLPTIDRLEQPAGLVLATGFSGHGFGMGPIVGKLVSELILDGEPSLDLSAFRFSRFNDGSKLTPHSVI